MDKIQKGVSMAKAEAFNHIVKIVNKYNTDTENIVYNVENIIQETLKNIKYIKKRYNIEK